MPDLDEYLSTALRRTIKSVDVNDVSTRIDLRRRRRALVRKVQSSALTVIVLAGTVGGVAALSVAFRNEATRPAATRVPAAEDIGLGFPVCDVRTFVGNWSGNGSVAYLATGAKDAGGCPTLADGATQVLALDEDGDGMIDVSFGSLQCVPTCRFFAAPDIDLDGRQELAIVHGVNGSTASIRIYSMITTDQPALVPWQEGGKDLEFAWDTSSDHRAGAFCAENEAGPEFVVWDAERLGPGHFREDRVRYHVDGTTFGGDGVDQPITETIEVPDDEPLLPRLDRFCGSTLNSTGFGT